MELVRKNSRIYVAGHRGLLGSAIVRTLKQRGYSSLITATSSELDLRDQAAVNRFIELHQPEFVVLAAARVGGILANDRFAADFIADNLQIQTNVILASHNAGVQRLVFMGSTCIYPKMAPQPLREESLLTGPLEPTNQWYAVAKIAGVMLCQALRRQHGSDFVSLMSTNLYGPGDNFDLESSHVLPALLRKFHEAHLAGDRPVSLWGSGQPRREFLFSEDLADACLFVLREPESSLHRAAYNTLLNVGVGHDLSIRRLADIIQEVVGSRCLLQFDTSKPDGTPRKLVDVSRLHSLGWTAATTLPNGLRRTYDWYRKNAA